MRYQGPGPVTTARSRVLPPYQATVRVVRWAVAATTPGGDASFWPCTRGRPRVPGVRAGEGAYNAASPIPCADQRALTAVFAIQPRGLAGAAAGIPPPLHWRFGNQRTTRAQRRQRWMARPMDLSPCWAAGSGHPHREGPGPDRERQLDRPRHDAPAGAPTDTRYRCGGRAPHHDGVPCRRPAGPGVLRPDHPRPVAPLQSAPHRSPARLAIGAPAPLETSVAATTPAARRRRHPVHEDARTVSWW
jgi:hypothetical protein